jgi:Zn-dependent membrane protease YugP
MRSQLVPVVSFASNIVQWVLLAGILLIKAFPSLLLVGIVLFAATTLFSIITLPVEYDASNRALAWLRDKRIVNQAEYAGAEDALKWAARTYLVAAIGSIATLLYYVSIFMGSRERE